MQRKSWMLESHWIHNENQKTKRKIMSGFMLSHNSESLIKMGFLNWNFGVICQILLFLSNVKWRTLGIKPNFSV